jgi:cardiolipin synthase (CMP-forming)
MWSNLPNFLTIGRILLVPFTVWSLIRGDYSIALIAFLVAGISDGLDGYLARRFGLLSELGASLDPLADKALLVSIYVTLAVLDYLPDWLTIIVVTRDVLIVSAVLLATFLTKPLKIRPVYISKVNTVAQIVLVLAVLASLAFDVSLDGWMLAACVFVAALTLGSLAVYMRFWLSHMTREDIS